MGDFRGVSLAEDHLPALVGEPFGLACKRREFLPRIESEARMAPYGIDLMFKVCLVRHESMILKTREKWINTFSKHKNLCLNDFLCQETSASSSIFCNGPTPI